MDVVTALGDAAGIVMKMKDPRSPDGCVAGAGGDADVSFGNGDGTEAVQPVNCVVDDTTGTTTNGAENHSTAVMEPTALECERRVIMPSQSCDTNDSSLSTLSPGLLVQNNIRMPSAALHPRDKKDSSNLPNSDKIVANQQNDAKESELNISRFQQLSDVDGDSSEISNLVIDEQESEPVTSMNIDPGIADTLSHLEKLQPEIQSAEIESANKLGENVTESDSYIVTTTAEAATITENISPAATAANAGPTIVCSSSLKSVVRAMADFGMLNVNKENDGSSQNGNFATDKKSACSEKCPLARVTESTPTLTDGETKKVTESSVSSKNKRTNLLAFHEHSIVNESQAIVIDDDNDDEDDDDDDEDEDDDGVLDVPSSALLTATTKKSTNDCESHDATIPAKSRTLCTTRKTSVGSNDGINTSENNVVTAKSSPPVMTAASNVSSDSMPMISQIYGGVTEHCLVALHSHGSVSEMETRPKPTSLLATTSLLTDILKGTNKSGLSAPVVSKQSSMQCSSPILAALAAPKIVSMSAPPRALDSTSKIIHQKPLVIAPKPQCSVIQIVNNGKSRKTAIVVENHVERPWSPSDEAIKKEKVDSGYDSALKKALQKPVQRSQKKAGNVIMINGPNFQPLGSPPTVKKVYTQDVTRASTNVLAARSHFRSIIKGPRLPRNIHTLGPTPNQVSIIQMPPICKTSAVMLPDGSVMSKAGNVQFAVPLLISKPGTVQTSQSQQVIFTLAPVPKLSIATNSKVTSTVTVVAPSTPTISVLKNAKKRNLSGSEEDQPNEYIRYLAKIGSFKKKADIFKEADTKYVCPTPPPSLLLDSRFHKMYVCRGCESMFNKQTTLSDHQLRRTLCLRYSCRPSCHVLFYNMCQLMLHMRTHPPSVLDWQANIEITGLPESLMRQIETADGRFYDDIKKSTYVGSKFEKKPPAKKRRLDASPEANEPSVDSPLSVSPQPQEQSISTSVDCDSRPKPHDSPLKIPGRPALVVNTMCNDRRVICTECGMMFQSRTMLASHMNNRSSNKFLYFCKTCPVVLRSKCAQSAHIRIHKNTAPFVCPECGQAVHGIHKVFWKHLHVKCAHHIRQALFTCTVPSCTKHLKDKPSLMKHTIDDHAMKFHKCLLCPMAFKTAGSFSLHAKRNHNGNNSHKIIHKCPLCDAVYNDDKFTSHIEQHLTKPSVEVVHRCNACNEVFDDRQRCLSHMEKMHKFYFNHHEMCHVCGVEFKNTATLFGHQKAAHSNIEKLDQALTKSLQQAGIIERTESISPPPLVNKAMLTNSHKNPEADISEDDILAIVDIKEEVPDECVETGHTEFTCCRCQTKFDDAATYQRHMAKHRYIEKKLILTKTGDDLICKPVVGKDGNLVLKIKLPKLKPSILAREEKQLYEPKVFTKQMPEAPDPKPYYFCSECDNGFYLEANLNAHLKNDHGLDRQFPCHLCGKTYIDPVALKSHVKKRHQGSGKEKPFVCWICLEKDVSKGFYKRVHLIKHISKEHKIARAMIDYSKFPDNKEGDTVDGDQEGQSEHGEDSIDADIPAVKRLKLEGELSYSCAKCSFTADNRQSFLDHIPKHQTAHLQGLMQCKECGLSFAVAPSLKRHLFVVHQIRNFEKYFSDSGMDLVSQAKEEEVTMPTVTVNPPLDNISKVRGEAKVYVRKRPAKVDVNMEDYGLECKVCYKLYDSDVELRAHMRNHGMAFIRSKRFDST